VQSYKKFLNCANGFKENIVPLQLVMKKIYFILICLAIALAANAQTNDTKTKQKRKVELYGEVYDSFTKARVKAHMTLMRTDSTVVDTATCYTWGTNSFYLFKVPAEHADFIIKAEAEGYLDTFLNYELRHIARNSSFLLPRMLMKKKQDEIWRESSLDGVVVTGTKVKIAYRGDTIVYNASAFNLPEGSMLDGLIRQMPGAELKDNGDIYINGKKIDYLTLNGKDFFKGQNKVMLDNLPYFTVKDIKVYNKSTKQSQMIGHDVEKKDYVMDVALKREYNRGFMANAEAGAGTDDRYMARLFALYYDDHTRVSLFGNTNNVNETRHPGGEGEWRPSNMPQGLRATKQAGLNLNTENADKDWEETLNASVEWSDADNLSRTASETFATDGNIFGASESRSRQKDFRVAASNEFQLMKPIQLYTHLSMNYANGKRSTTSRDSTYRDFVINQTRNDGLNKYRTLGLNGSVYSLKKFDWGDYVMLMFQGNYNRQKPSEQFNRNLTIFNQTATEDYRDYYADTHGDSYSYSINGNYVLQLLNRWFIDTNVSYQQARDNVRNSNYRLDWLGGVTPYNHNLGWLPSTFEALNGVIDTNNTDSYQKLTRTYGGSVSLHHNNDNQFFSIELPVNFNRERLHYDDLSLDTVAYRTYTNFTPSVNYYRWNVKKGLQRATYNMNVSRPDFASLMPTDDTTNPLALRINNPDLKATISHMFGIGFAFNNDSLRRNLELWSNLQISTNSWGTQTTYDQLSGAYTFYNDNVNGNWNWSIGNSYQMPLDKAKRLTLQQRTNVNYTHSVDFDILYLAAGTQTTGKHPTSTVNNWTLGEHLGIEYQRDKLTVGIAGDVNWRNSTSDRKNFQRINAVDFNYGARLMYTIPWAKVSLATDIKMFSRRGYQSAMMNTDELVWNAELARSLMKERLTLKLTAFDLLHQLSSTQYNVNAQGRTETWQNCIPRYVMFSLAYKFTRTPKH